MRSDKPSTTTLLKSLQWWKLQTSSSSIEGRDKEESSTAKKAMNWMGWNALEV